MINVYAFSYWDILVSMNQDMMDQGMTVSETQRQGQLSINTFKNNMILREPPEDHSGQVWLKLAKWFLTRRFLNDFFAYLFLICIIGQKSAKVKSS